MLTPEQIDALRDRFELISEPVNRYLIQSITRRIIEAGQITSTARYEAEIARMLGVTEADVKRYLKYEIRREMDDFKAVFNQVASLTYNQTAAASGAALGFENNESIQNIVQAAVNLAEADLTNITQTLGMIDPYGNALPLQKAYRAYTDYAFKKVVTGAQDYQSAVRSAVAALTKYGVQVIDYESGVHTSLDAAIRRNIFGGMGLMVEQIEQKAHDEIGCNGWELSAHEASAPDHEPYQGRQFTDAAYEALNGTPDKPGILLRRIGTLNCKHIAFPIILGVNKPIYSKEELDAMKERNAKGIVYDGKHYTKYEATQMQRRIERNIRRQKRRILAFEQSPVFKDQLLKAQSKYTVLKGKYKEFSQAADLRTQPERLEVIGYGPDQEIYTNFSLSKENQRGIIKSLRNKSPDGVSITISQEAIDNIINGDLSNVKFTKHPIYNSRIRSQGKTTYDVFSWGELKSIKSIEIGKQSRDTKECLIDTLLHEELEVRLLQRKGAEWVRSAGDAVIHPYIDKVIKRYFELKGWDYELARS